MLYFLRSMAVYLRPYRLMVGVIFFAIAVQMLFRLALPFSFQITVDQAIPNADLLLFEKIIAALLIFWLLQTLLSVVQDVFSARAGLAAGNDIRKTMFNQLRILPVDYFSQHQTGDLLSRFSVDLAAIEQAAVRSLYVFLFSCLNVIGSLLLLFIIEWRLAAFTLAGMVFSALVPKRFSKGAQEKSFVRKEEEGRLNSFVQETLGTFDIIHAFNLWPSQTEKFAQQLGRFKRTAEKAYLLYAVVGRLGSQSAAFIQVLILALGGFMVLKGWTTLGTLFAFLALLQNLVAGTSHLAGVLPEMMQASGAMRRVQQFLFDTAVDHGEESKPALPRLHKAIAFDGVGFRYRKNETIFRGLDFVIEKGRSVAIVGPSGSGKSSILKLFLRYYDPQGGSIFWDGVNVVEYSKESLRDQVSIVHQDTVLFDTSIAENIRMGRLGATEGEVIAAAKAAELHDLILKMPDGYETKVGERGNRLSGGQRQRVAIARAILRDPALLILDEATSALDPITEKAVNDTLMRIAQDRTMISVTHRLHTITEMDWIMVMDGGYVVEQGRHEDLLEACGLYERLWRKQNGFTFSEDGLMAEITPERLKLIPLFENLEQEALLKVSQQLVSEYLPEHRLLFSKGDRGDRLYILVNGHVAVSDLEGHADDEEPLLLDSGDFFGEVALLDKSPRNATITTVTPCLFLTLTQRRLADLMAAIPALQAAIIKSANKRRGVG